MIKKIYISLISDLKIQSFRIDTFSSHKYTICVCVCIYIYIYI